MVRGNFTREKFLSGKHLTSSSKKMASRINCKFYIHSLNRVLHKTVPTFFLIVSYSFFIAITWWALKAHFAWNQLKVDYSKNIWKEENCGHSFVCLLVGYISVKKNYWKLQFCCCRSLEYRKSSQFLAQLSP